MKITKTKIADAYIIKHDPHTDERGSFCRVFCKNELQAAGLCGDMVQANISANIKRGTLRGLHSQQSEFAEDKLVTCIRGSIFDVCADVRKDSPTYKQWVGLELSESNGYALYVPKGCAHGYLSLTDDTHVLYFVSEFYVASSEVGYKWDDPAFGIDWATHATPPYTISDKDMSWQPISE